MSSLSRTRRVFRALRNNRRRACASLLAIALSTAMAQAGDQNRPTRQTSGRGVPAWVLKECRPWTGAEILARIAGPGEWFYRESGDFCYLDTRPGVM